MNIVRDVIQRYIPFKEAFNTRIKDSATNLKRKAEEKIDILMKGSRYKTMRESNIEHLINTIPCRWSYRETAEEDDSE